ncbi:glycosyltransferase family 4 protein [Methanomassiliicoccus luminyensis]|uniref:glycosyltransferase family 4 protein n=1 Tax=Methanomassiliicoccus luminyensis TaxID=1080712 RepID=UPI0004744BD0|nr:glycosyltransferase family 4 protein [Methanomassiliicoccus luminyensis]
MSERNLLIISNDFPNQDNSYIGGIFVKEQVKYLKHHFDKVYVVSPVAHGMERLRNTKHDDYQFDDVQVFFPRYINNPLFWNHGRFMWVNLELRAIESLIKRERINFDLIHAHFTWPSGAVAVELKRIMGIPTIITEHTHQTLYKAIRQKNRHFINTWRDCDALIRVNKKDISQICSCGINPSKVHYIANGYDPKKYHPISMDRARQLLGLPTDSKIILNIGRLYEEKGQKFLISAIGEIIGERDDFICYIGGSGPLRHNLEQQIVSLGLEKYIKLVGFIPDEQMYLWMNACDIFVMPSLAESFGIVQLEALACGKPILATRNGGSEEIIISDRYGILAEPGDSDDLAEKIHMALDREWDREAIKQYAERYTWENISKEILCIYDEFI